MKFDPKADNSRVLLTEAVMNPLKNREKMAEIIFDYYGFSKMQVNVQALFALFAEGRLSATLLDTGDGVTHCVPIFSGNLTGCLN